MALFTWIRNFLWCILLTPIWLVGQDSILYFHTLNEVSNLTAQSDNYYLYQDSKGYVWISSITGLNRFDGKTIHPYLHQSDDPHSLLDNNVHSQFFEDSDQNLWFATNDGLNCYDRKQGHFLRFTPGQKTQNEYQLLWLDTLEQALWFRNKHQFFRSSVSQPENIDTLGSFSSSIRTRMMKEPGSGDLLLLQPGRGGLTAYKWKDTAFLPYFKFTGEGVEPPFHALSIWIEHPNSYWVGAAEGLFHVNPTTGQLREYARFRGNSLTHITSIVPWGDGQLLVASRNQGIFVFDPAQGSYLFPLYSDERDRVVPFPYQVERLFRTLDGTLWVTSQTSGIFFTQPDKRKFSLLIPKPQNKAENPNFIRSISEDREGNIVCLTRDGLAIFPREAPVSSRWKQVIQESERFTGGESYQTICDREGRLWVCTQSGLYVLEPGAIEFRSVNLDPRQNRRDIVYVRQLRDGTILACGEGVGEVGKADGNWHLRRIDAVSPTNAGYAGVFENRVGNIFFCRLGSMIQIGRKQGPRYHILDSVSFTPMVTGMIPMKSGGGMWVSSFEGLFRLEMQENRWVISPEQGCPLLTISALLKDDLDYLWMSNNQGLHRYDPSKKKLESFERADGLQSREFNFWAAYESGDGRLFFGGVNGLNVVNPRQLKRVSHQAIPSIVDILVNNLPLDSTVLCEVTQAKNVTEMKAISLGYWENTLSFRFAAMDYSEPSAAGYRYELLANGKETVDQGFLDRVTYANLSPGRYELKLFVANSDGVWNPEPRIFRFYIRPHFTETWWFASLIALAILGIAIAIYRNRLDRVRKQQELAEYQQLVAEAETALLRVQMNPHFIFNILNSIRGYIQDGDIQTSDRFLVQAARLMRRILDLAPKPLIALEEEQSILEAYMKVERLRFNQAFDFRFEFDDDLDPDEVMIPRCSYSLSLKTRLSTDWRPRKGMA